MGYPRAAVHRTIVVVDVEGFANRRRTNVDQVAVREGLYLTLRKAFEAVGMPWTDCRCEDRGDGVFILAPAQLPKGPFAESLPLALAAALREHNAAHGGTKQIRLRMVLHAGEIVFDEHGVTAASINLAFRLLDAGPLKAALAQSPGVLAVMASEWFFDEVVRHSQGSDAATWRPVRVVVKETSTVGWVCLPDHPYPADTTHLEASPPRDPATPVPHQLPAPPRCFAGRIDELTALASALDNSAATGATVVISAIAGAGGIGKTWLALHWAHQNLDRFPDGQLFVDLRGFTHAGGPMPPGVAVRGFLDAFGIEAARIPVELDAQAALYRSLVVGKRMLIMLDNARDVRQVIPLLPGSQTCTVIITSRDQLHGLISAHGAQPLALDVLDEHDARDLLAQRLGHERLNAEPEAVAELLTYCACLPLALGIVAARATAHTDFPLAGLATELRDMATRLGALDTGEPTASLSAVLSWSTAALDVEQAAVFGLLGLVPGPDIALPAAASLSDLSTARTGAVLRVLERVSLIQQHQPGRWRMHDLIRLYAATQAHHNQGHFRADAALRRLVDHYLHTAFASERLIDPSPPAIELGPAVPGCHPHLPPDPATALAWFDAEHPGLLATQRFALEQGWHQAVWQLAWSLESFHFRRGHFHDRLGAWQLGLTAANELGDLTTQARAHRFLGDACARVGRHAEALDHLHRALTSAQDAGDLAAQAHTHKALARSWEQRKKDQQALEHATHSLRIYQTLSNPVWEADALNDVGWYAARLGHYAQGYTHCEAALALFRRHHDRTGEAGTLDSLGYIAQHCGRYVQALDYYQQALILYRTIGNIYFEANTLDRLGRTHAALGHYDSAHDVWRQALLLYQAQHRTQDAERIQQQLTAGTS